MLAIRPKKCVFSCLTPSFCYICRRKSLGKVAQLPKKSLGKVAQTAEKSLGKVAQRKLNSCK